MIVKGLRFHQVGLALSWDRFRVRSKFAVALVLHGHIKYTGPYSGVASRSHKGIIVRSF